MAAGAAALLVALVAGGAYFVLRPDDGGRPTITTTAPAPEPLTGTWSGTVSGDESGFDVVADITGESPLTATVTYPQLNCSGSWAETGTVGADRWQLTETIDRGSCVQSTVTLTRNDDGTLDYASTYFSESQNRNFTIRATLQR